MFVFLFFISTNRTRYFKTQFSFLFFSLSLSLALALIIVSTLSQHFHFFLFDCFDTVQRLNSVIPSCIEQVLSCHGPSKPQRVVVEKVELKEESITPPQPVIRTSFLETSSLTSIEKSPTLSHRPWLLDENRRTTSELLFPAVWDLSYHEKRVQPNAIGEYSAGRFLAPIATPETLSEESVAGSKSGSVRGGVSKLMWRREKAARKEKPKVREPLHPHLYEPLPGARQQSPGSDVCDLVTESSSVYCASPLSSVRTSCVTHGSSTRSQLKREIMRLYQRAAADVDQTVMEQSGSVPSTSSSRSNSRSVGSSSSPSQSRPFPLIDPSSPVFGVSNQQLYVVSPVTSRPATANGTTGRQAYSSAKPSLPPCNTSF